MSDAAKRAITFEDLGLTGDKRCASKLDAIHYGVNANALSKYQDDNLIRYSDLPAKLTISINVFDVQSAGVRYSWKINEANVQYSHYGNATTLVVSIGDTLVIGHGLKVGDSAEVGFYSNGALFKGSDGVYTPDYQYGYNYDIRGYGEGTGDLKGTIEFRGYGTIDLIIKSNISS